MRLSFVARLAFVALPVSLAFVIVAGGCGGSGAAHQRLRVEVDATLLAEARAAARAEAEAQVEAEVEVRVETPEVGVEIEGEADVETPAETREDVDVDVELDVEVEVPDRPVALEGSGYVEFFGIPLDGAQDVVFVLDRSGSMTEPAQVRLAHLEDPGGADAEGQQADLADDDVADETSPDVDGLDADVGDVDDPVSDDPAFAEPDTMPSDADDEPPDSESEQPQEPRAPPPPRKIDVAQAELIDALERIAEGTRINIIFFNNRLEAAAADLISLDDSGRDQLIRFVSETAPTGRTALAPAMRAAYLMEARRIVLLSDGLGNIGGDADAVLRDAREAMRGGVRIDVIGLGTNQDASLLQTIARESGGLYQGL